MTLSKQKVVRLRQGGNARVWHIYWLLVPGDNGGYKNRRMDIIG